MSAVRGKIIPLLSPRSRRRVAVREASSSGVILAAPPRAVVVSFAVVTPLLSPVPPPAAKSSDSSVSGGSSARLHGLYTGNGGGDPSGRLGAAPGGVSSATHVSSPGRSPAPAVGRNAGPEQYVVLSWAMLLSFQNLSFLSGSCESVYVFRSKALCGYDGASQDFIRIFLRLSSGLCFGILCIESRVEDPKPLNPQTLRP